MRSALLKAAAFAAFVSLLSLSVPGRALASPGNGATCANGGCHTSTTARANVTSATDTAVAGATTGTGLATFTANITNGGANTIGTAVALTGPTGNFSLAAIPGNTNPADILNLSSANLPGGISGWSYKTSASAPYYYSPASTALTFSQALSFMVPANTPADTYNLLLKVSGSDSTGEWTQSIPIQLTVGAVPEPATLVMLFGGALVGFVCWRGRKHLAAK